MERLLIEKTAIVTGARRGIGKKISELFAHEGANVYACDLVVDDEFEKWTSELSAEENVKIVPVAFNVCNADEVKENMKAIFSDCDIIDILVNNAGIASAGTLRMTTMDSLRNTFEVNYFAPIQIMQIVAGKMMRKKQGSIINIASVGGIEAQPGYLSYGSSKAALIWATRSLSKELGPFNIRVNAVAPGMTKTNMGGAYKSDEQLNETINRTALRRMAEPSEIAEAVLFLASDKSSFVTGEILQVDGGRV